MNFSLIPVLICVLSFVLPAQSQGTETTWNNGVGLNSLYVPIPEMKGEIESRWNEIGEDVKTEKNPLTGTYAELGSESGYFLRWSTKKGFILIPYFDQSMVVDYSYGKVVITPDSEIKLIPEKEFTGRGRWYRKTPKVWIPAINGAFLVPKVQFTSFVDYFGGYGQFNGFPRKKFCDGCGTFAARQDMDGNYPKEFLAPPKYLKYIKKPIEAEIIYVGKNRKGWSTANTLHITGDKVLSSITPVLINAGQRHGVRTGLMFLLINSGDNYEQVLKITLVDANRSEGIIVRNIDASFPALKRGIRVTTSPITQ